MYWYLNPHKCIALSWKERISRQLHLFGWHPKFHYYAWEDKSLFIPRSLVEKKYLELGQQKYLEWATSWKQDRAIEHKIMCRYCDKVFRILK